FFQADAGIRDRNVTGVQTCALPIFELDADYYSGDYSAVGRFPAQGLGLARQIAHLTYRNDVELNQRFSCRLRSENYYEVTSYLDHQAKKLTARRSEERRVGRG